MNRFGMLANIIYAAMPEFGQPDCISTCHVRAFTAAES
jgi:hypothetical protein